jgi:hypothetical protein
MNGWLVKFTLQCEYETAGKLTFPGALLIQDGLELEDVSDAEARDMEELEAFIVKDEISAKRAFYSIWEIKPDRILSQTNYYQKRPDWDDDDEIELGPIDVDEVVQLDADGEIIMN